MNTTAPLAERLRPQTLDEVVGQQHLLSKDKVFRRTIDSGRIPNMIFYGPSGCGKTTVARIIAQNSGMKLHKLNGTSASTGDIRDVMSDIGTFGSQNGILLYLDEIQYLNKKQQQSLLEYIEDGSITLIASTTENPYFYIYNALLSRCTVFEFKPLTADDTEQGLKNAAKKIEQADKIKITFEKGALRKLAVACGGDMRKALNGLEFAISAAPEKDGKRKLTLEAAGQVAQRSSMRYDRAGEEHYDIISGYQKAMRGSDVDAALHYLARLLVADDLVSACRRLVVCASEDVGLAYPQILPIVKAAVDIALQVGLPEAQIPLADAVVLVCLAPKSNAAAEAIFAAMDDVRKGNSGPIPRQLQNKHFDGADADVKGQNYLYPHSYPNHWVQQQYLPDILKNTTYYTPGENKTEQSFKEYWEKIKGKK
ncbi:replication-associated recombination protein A [Ruminococcaceae bacterium OttesenSCG-928-A16]|nr:replication-associated recombination protein A [Ruminococcaceae bacterium OttesenSCG-928-A16]